ncbi:amino-acid permease inda1 [Delphinella strobiligena]|nr:amino-acid permease inda1 [Delphinella strobiligena]
MHGVPLHEGPIPEKDVHAVLDSSHSSKDIENGVGVAEAVEEGQVLKRDLQGRHMQMIAIGGSIGAGLFVGSGGSLTTGGPGFLLIGFLLVGLLLLFTMQALGELAVMYPVNGAFFDYSYRFLDKSWGFSMGWLYAFSWFCVLPYELTAAGLTIRYWRPDLNVGIWIAVFLAALIIIQIFGVRGYGEVEFVLAMIKITAIVGFIILGIVIDCGGVSTDNRGYIGAHYWHNPGAFNNGFKGFVSVFTNAAFAYSGTELVGLAAAEAANPRIALPKATRQVFFRIAIFYVLSLFIVGLIVPSNNPDLLSASNSNTKDAPFVLAIKLAGIKGLPSVFNTVITLSVLSVANSCTFASTRTIHALACKKMAPKFLTYLDSKGRPVGAIVIQICFGLLAFINEDKTAGSQFFNWLLAITGLAGLFCWGSICLAHIRFRAGWKAQGRTVDEIPWSTPTGVWGSWCGFILVALLLIAEFYISVWPIGTSPNAQSFFENYLAAVVAIGLYVFWKIIGKDFSLFIRASDMDLDTGRRTFDAEEEAAIDQELKSRPFWRKVYSAIF